MKGVSYMIEVITKTLLLRSQLQRLGKVESAKFLTCANHDEALALPLRIHKLQLV